MLHQIHNYNSDGSTDEGHCDGPTSLNLGTYRDIIKTQYFTRAIQDADHKQRQPSSGSLYQRQQKGKGWRN